MMFYPIQHFFSFNVDLTTTDLLDVALPVGGEGFWLLNWNQLFQKDMED